MPQIKTQNQHSADLIFSIVLFLACPALAIVSSLYYIYKQQYGHLTILALSIAMVTLFTPPFADIYRHTMLYFYYGNYAWDGFIQTNDHDYIFYTLTHLFSHYNIPFEYISFIFVFTCYQISFYLFKQTIKTELAQQWSRNTIYIVFLCFALMVPFIAIVNGLRMATAAYIGVLGWYLLYNHKTIRGIIAFFIAYAMHFGSLLFIPIVIYMILPKVHIKQWVFITGFFILFIAGDFLMYILPEEFIATAELEDQVTGYMEDSEERFDDTMSFNGLIAMFLERSPLIVVGILALFNRININKKDLSIIYVVIWMAVLYFPFTVLFQRFAFFAIPIVVFILLNNTPQPAPQKWGMHKTILVSCIVMTLSYMYGYRAPLTHTKYYKMFYPSVYTILATDTQENFRNGLIPK